MNRWVALLLVGLMVAVPAASADGWLQPRGDAAASGFQPGGGPAWPDVALRVPVEIPGVDNVQPVDDSPPLILEDRIVFMAAPTADDGDGTMHAYALDVATGELALITKVPFAQPMRMATDGQTLYLSGDGTVHARPLEPGGHNWTWTWSSEVNPEAEQASAASLHRCPRMVLEAEHVTVACYLKDVRTRAEASTPVLSQTRTYQLSFGLAGTIVARLDAASGQHEWVRQPGSPSPEDDPSSLDSEGQSAPKEFPIGLATAGRSVVAATLDLSSQCDFTGTSGDTCAGQLGVSVYAFDRESGTSQWSAPWRSPRFNQTQALGESPSGPGGTGATMNQGLPELGNPAITDRAIYIKAGKLYKLNLGTGAHLWDKEIGQGDVTREGDLDTAVALAGQHVYANTAQTVYRVDKDNPEKGWTTSLNFSAGEGFMEDTIVTPSHVYGATTTGDQDEDLYAFGTDRGEQAWHHEVEDILWSFSVGHGRLAYMHFNTTGEDLKTEVVVLGTTEASPTPHTEVPDAYPTPGDEITVDLSGSEAGLQGPVTRYKAIWGDGNETGWQVDPVLTHTYEAGGDTTARFIVANDANQTASTAQTFHVGQSQPNLVETAFQKDNQDMTFGILGLAVALGGGAIGVARRKKKQATLQDELEALERGFQETQDRPSECEAFLDNRKARARSLAIDGDLEEQQVSIIENRAEELRGGLRLGALEEEFAFLPHGLVTKAREMVQDGDVTSLEREAFLAALEEDELLTEEQRSIVRERIERWHGRDKGGGAR